MTSEARKRRALWQILLLSAGFLALVIVSVGAVLLVDKARDHSRLVVHTVEVESQLSISCWKFAVPKAPPAPIC